MNWSDIKTAVDQASLARRLGITLQAVSQWPRVPPMRVLEVERFTGIPRYVLRPDVYPPERPAEPERQAS